MERRCPRCEELVDDTWRVLRNGKMEVLCPGCVAACRTRGDRVEVLGTVEER